MKTTIAVTMLTSLAQAAYLPILRPITVRNTQPNNTTNIYPGHNTLLVPEAARKYDTAAYRVYITFLVFGIVMAIVVVPIACSNDTMHWYRAMRAKKGIQQRKVDVEAATRKMREMTQQPDRAYLRPEQ